ncbi:MAG: hypothetical protein ACK587_05950 [Cyanobacteriota bacterium]
MEISLQESDAKLPITLWLEGVVAEKKSPQQEATSLSFSELGMKPAGNA